MGRDFFSRCKILHTFSSVLAPDARILALDTIDSNTILKLVITEGIRNGIKVRLTAKNPSLRAVKPPKVIYTDERHSDIVGDRVDRGKKMNAIIGTIREKVNSVDRAVLVDCIRIGTDMSQGDGFTHYMVTALARSGRYITWRAIYRRENGVFDLVLDGGRYDFESIESALCDMYDRARAALESAHWENVRQEAI